MRLRRRAGSAEGLHVLVTGAGSGIGRAVAEQLGAAGAHLHLTDRDTAGLETTRDAVVAAGGSVPTAHPADVADAAQVAELAAAVHAVVPAVDVVMNVAGIAVWGRVEDLALEQWRRVVEVDLMGPVHVIDAFVPPMVRERRRGHLVNVSSAAGLVGLPLHAPYSAAKFGLRGISEVLRFDLARHGIAVTLVCPGAVDTPITGSVTVAGVDTTSEGFREMRARFERGAVSAGTAAECIIAGMLARRYLVFTSRDMRVLHAVQRYAPPVYVLVMDRMNRRVDRATRSWT